MWASPPFDYYKFSYSVVLKACDNKLFEITEFTNTPITAVEGAGRFSRRIDTALQGEWGKLVQYTGSYWVSDYYWPKLMSNSSIYYTIHADNGSIRVFSSSSLVYQACKF